MEDGSAVMSMPPALPRKSIRGYDFGDADGDEDMADVEQVDKHDHSF